MPINKETIISVFTEKLTLEQWLKTINKALDEAVLTGVEIAKKGNATLSFKFTFEDGTYLESNDIVLQQGESVNGAYIQNGHLYLTLTNDQTLDAGNVKPVSNFSIDVSQHLIVNYGDGTSQDLGAIFQGNVNISGTLTATIVDAGKVTGDEIVEKMSNYSFTKSTSDSDITYNDYVYAGVVKNGNKVTLALGVNITRLQDLSNYKQNKKIGMFTLPAGVASKLYPSYADVWFGAVMATIKCLASDTSSNAIALDVIVGKTLNSLDIYACGLNDLTLNKQYYLRFEITFLLSDNLAQ